MKMEQNQQSSEELLLKEFLARTIQLEASVNKEEDDPDEWLALIDARQEIIEKLTCCQEQGVRLDEALKQTYLKPALEINQRLMPLMEAKKNGMQKKIQDLNRAKSVNQQYAGEYGYAPYGAFFDKRK